MNRAELPAGYDAWRTDNDDTNVKCRRCEHLIEISTVIEMNDDYYCETCAQKHGTQCPSCYTYYSGGSGFDYGHDEMCDNCCDNAADKITEEDR